MNFTKKIAATTAAIALTASFASAQAPAVSVGPSDFANHSQSNISFSVTVAQVAKIEVTDEALDEGGLVMANTGTIAIGDLALAGIVDVQTNMAAWDVTVSATNGGKLLNTNPGAAANDYLKIVKGGIVSDAVLRLNACTAVGVVTEAFITAAGTPATNECGKPGNIAQGAVLGTDGVLKTSLATALGKTGGWKAGTADVNTDGEAHIAIYAGLPATEDELAGNGTYTETLEFTLISMY